MPLSAATQSCGAIFSRTANLLKSDLLTSILEVASSSSPTKRGKRGDLKWWCQNVPLCWLYKANGWYENDVIEPRKARSDNVMATGIPGRQLRVPRFLVFYG